MNNRVTVYYQDEDQSNAYSEMCMFMAALLKQDLLELSYGPSSVDSDISDFSFHTTDEQHNRLKQLFKENDKDLFGE